MPLKINPITGEFDLVGVSTTPVSVANGGTGLTTLTDGSVMVGNGTSAIELIALTDGQFLIGNTAGPSPTASTLTAGSNITITNAAGSVTIASGLAVRSFPFPSSGLQPIETNSAPLELLTGTNVKVYERSYDDTTEEFANSVFPIPSDIDPAGTVTFRVWVMAKTAAADKNLAFTFGHLVIASGGDFDPASPYTDVDSGDIAISATQDGVTEMTWTRTVSALAWVANRLTLFRLSRDPGAGSDLTGDALVFLLVIDCPRI